VHRRSARRLSAIVALAATLASLAMPAVAMPIRATHGDMCVGGKLVPAAPAPVVHDCEACCASTPAALPGGDAPPAVVPLAPISIVVVVTPATGDTRTHVAQARAPPVS
jgi:hypothetical protein